jgi:putative transposase
MPDHVHALVEGLRIDSQLVKFVGMFEQRTAFDHAQTHVGRLWQEGFFDRVLRSEDDVLGIAAYVVANPLRAGLCRSAGDYPYLGSDRYTIEQLCEAIQMAPMSRP